MEFDVLHPQLVHIGGRCYRKYTTNAASREEDEYIRPYQEEEYDDRDVYCDEICGVDVNVEQTEKGYRSKMDVPSAYFKFIIGKKGETKRKLEYETKTQIRIPRQGQEGDIVIHGQDRKGVVSARTRIEVMVDSARQRLPFTHFLSLPVNGQKIKDAFLDFKADVLRECDGDRGIVPAVFQNPDKLHLTLGIMALMNGTEIAKATDLLQQCREDLVNPILKGEPLDAIIQGLGYMNDEPGKVNVLYANVMLQDGSDRLQVLADRIKDRFVSAGLLKKDSYERVKLHVTLMNAKFIGDAHKEIASKSQDVRQQEQLQFSGEREYFDATNVLRMFRDYKFGEHLIDSLHISQRGFYDKDGYYAAAAKVPLT
ncbi:activating signal cointegrator 1 complex subunit 1 [Lingula anatina]|uniref:Activating signal cointegrator 1 complex subunit 1 n=1 Tax=Lingula anatina TaxID=7574 RepID=A0A1S3ITM7_LINAN|nr:activating signal cointegrator 1 complex subunit 1 [Lingula anatina]XP_013401286.1 activating signal cointegrator 1 complex subunit 1 [Lingula anatina]|eukprot:XP_013401285.1 activating signal cointegrator 1 complex subunit 1 [Lingula anatina]